MLNFFTLSSRLHSILRVRGVVLLAHHNAASKLAWICSLRSTASSVSLLRFVGGLRSQVLSWSRILPLRDWDLWGILCISTTSLSRNTSMPCSWPRCFVVFSATPRFNESISNVLFQQCQTHLEQSNQVEYCEGNCSDPVCEEEWHDDCYNHEINSCQQPCKVKQQRPILGILKGYQLFPPYTKTQ